MDTDKIKFLTPKDLESAGFEKVESRWDTVYWELEDIRVYDDTIGYYLFAGNNPVHCVYTLDQLQRFDRS